MNPRLVRALLVAIPALSGCDSGLGHDPRPKSGNTTVDEAAPESLTRFGFDVGVALVHPVTGVPAPPRELAIDGSSITGLGSVVFVGFTTPAAADDGDGAGGDLDPSAPGDANDGDDVFLAALAQGTRRDVVLVSRASGGATAATGISSRASLAFEVNPTFDPGDPPATNPAGWVHVAFVSSASDLVGAPGLDHNGGQDDVFRVTVAVNVVAGPAGASIDLVRVEVGTGAPQYVSAPNGLAGTAGGATAVSRNPVIVGDGDLVAFDGSDGNLVGGDANGRRDVFLRRPSSNLTFRVTAGNGDSERPALTDDVVPVLAFESLANNFAGVVDGNGERDIYFAALAFVPGGPTFNLDPFKRASVATGGAEVHGNIGATGATRPTIHVITADVDGSNGPDGADGDGRIDQVQIAFESDSTDIVAAFPTPSTTNVYLFDNRGAGTTLLLNQRIGPGGATLGSADGGASPCDSFHPSFQPSGSAVAFETLADNLDTFQPSDQNDAKDVVLADIRQAFVSGTLRIHRLSVTTTGGDADGASSNAVFGTVAGAGGASGGVTPYFSQALAGLMTADRCAGCHSFLTPNPSFGHAVGNPNCNCTDCHTTDVGDPGDEDVWTVPPPELDFRNKSADVLCAQVRDTPNDRGNVKDHLKHDGRIVWGLVDLAPFPVHHLGNPTLTQQFGITRADWDALVDAWVDNGFQCRPFGAGSGDVVLFETTATNLGTGTGGTAIVGFPEVVTLERVSKTSGFPPTGGKQVNRSAFAASITRDDRFVAFVTSAPLDAARDANNSPDVYVRDLLLGTTTLVSHGSGSALAAAGTSTHPSATIAADGTLFVAFESNALNLAAGFVDGNGAGADVWLADFSNFDGSDPATITITLVSAKAGVPAAGGNGASVRPALTVTAIGPQVGFESLATDLVAGFVDGNGAAGPDVFVDDVLASGTRLVSSTFLSNVAGGNGASSEPAISDDGLFLAFTSTASDLVAAFVDGNGAGSDVFLRDLSLDSTTLVSAKDAVPGTGGDGASSHATLDGDGRVVAFESLAADLIPGFTDGNGATEPDVFAVDFNFLSVELVSASLAGAGTGGDDASRAPSLSADGNVVAFESDATDLLAGDANDATDVWLRDRGANSTRRMSLTIGGIEPRGASSAPKVGSDNGQIVFESLSDNLIGANVDTNGVGDVYRAQR